MTSVWEQDKTFWYIKLFDGNELVSEFRARPYGTDIEVHHGIYQMNKRVLQAFLIIWQQARDAWRQLGYKYIVAPSPIADDHQRRYWKVFGFEFETIQHGFICRVMEV